ncbi:mothers against decapentaplegic homolog 6-like [Ornithodoros turicata]|uniref:mothers against decapentaplegic homolog 6-like n=1 Tax=Ornithodoros turicata TaxID=34597 RepID=UPI0031386AB7
MGEQSKAPLEKLIRDYGVQGGVGPLYPVNRPWLHVSYDEASPPHSCKEETLSIGSLAKTRTTPCKEAVARTRAKIGLGVTLLRERDGVWVYNQSEHAVFVNSPTLDGPNVRNLTVFKATPCAVFDWERAALYRHHYQRHPPNEPFDTDSVHISFVKGWGNNYSRRIVTSCPCSLELLFRVPAR